MEASGYDPEQLPPKAEVSRELLWIWRAWHRLHSDRPMHPGGMGPPVPGRIPWMAVVSWCELHGMTRGEMMILDHCLGEMDGEYMRWWMQQQPSAEAKPRPKRGGSIE